MLSVSRTVGKLLSRRLCSVSRRKEPLGDALRRALASGLCWAFRNLSSLHLVLPVPAWHEREKFCQTASLQHTEVVPFLKRCGLRAAAAVTQLPQSWLLCLKERVRDNQHQRNLKKLVGEAGVTRKCVSSLVIVLNFKGNRVDRSWKNLGYRRFAFVALFAQV